MAKKKQTIGERIRSAREAKTPPWSVRELARQSGVDNSQISRAESGERTDLKTETVAALATALGVTLDWLVAGVEAAPISGPATTVAAGGTTTIEGDAANVVRLVAHADIIPSPLNPRKHFDAEALAELAGSIAGVGLLQNLVARPHPKQKGKLELAAGERRWRAIGLLLAGKVEGRSWPKDRPLPVQVRDLDDYQMIELGAGENIQRETMSPLEEGEAFVQLVDLAKARGEEGASERLAAKFGKTIRWVQQRMALSRKLTPKVKTALLKGEINVEQAKAFTLGDKKLQDEILDNVQQGAKWGELTTAENIREDMKEQLTPAGWAIFPLDQYKGEIVDDDGERFLSGKAEFLKLQKAAIEKKRKELAQEWAFAEIINGYWHDSQYPKSSDTKKAGAYIVVSFSHEVEIHTGRLKPKKPAAAASRATSAPKGPAKKSDPWRLGLVADCHRRKTAALQMAVIRSGRSTAHKVAIYGLIAGGEFSSVKMKGADLGRNNEDALAKPAQAKLAELGAKIGLKPHKELGAHTHSPFDGIRSGLWGGPSDGAQVKLWNAIAALSDDDAETLFIHLVASRVGTFNSYRPEIEDDRLAVAIAGTLGVTHGTDMAASPRFTPDDDFLKGYLRTGLVKAAISSGVFQKGDAKKLETMAGPKLRAEILTSTLRDPEWIPAELKFSQPKAKKGAATEEGDVDAADDEPETDDESEIDAEAA